MGGWPKTSTLDAITRGQLSPCLRSKAETASAATPRLSGHLTMAMLVIVMQYCSIFLAFAAVNSLPNGKQDMRFNVRKIQDLVLVEVLTVNYMHYMNHLMAMEIASHMQMNLAMVLHLMLQEKTCLQTKRMEVSQ
jgi:hypothetical protein